jgi:hypothetical protein
VADEFLLFGSDGFWDVFSNADAVGEAKQLLASEPGSLLCLLLLLLLLLLFIVFLVRKRRER